MAIRLAVETNQPLGSTGVDMLKVLREQLMDTVDHSELVKFPEIDEGWKLVDLLLLTELMNGALNAFLNPEEAEEKSKQSLVLTVLI